MRKFSDKKLIIASHNQGKIAEISQMLSIYNVQVLEAPSFKLEEPEETGSTFLENSAIKAQFVAKNTNVAAIADDSGLVVPALDGQPGIYSARWGGVNKDFNKAMERVGQELLLKTGSMQNHEAHFICALSLCWADGHIEQFEGRVDGVLTFPARGKNGFGYDAIFVPKQNIDDNKTFAEMESPEKKSISHRNEAFEKLICGCFVT